MKSILKSSFFHLLVLYSLAVLAISLGFLWKYSFKLDLFAILVALIGIFAISEKKSFKLSPKSAHLILLTCIIFTVFARTIPYIDNSVPLGYDAGIYKYVFDKFQDGLPGIPEANLDSWIRSGFPSGIAILSDIFYLYGIGSEEFIVPIFIILSTMTILPVYLTAKKYFGLEAGIFSAILFSISLTQLNAFWYFYSRNILALSTMLFALYFIDNKKFLIPTILFAAATGFLHQPTFLMLAFVWATYTIINFRDRKLLLSGLLGIFSTGIILAIIYFQRLNELVIAPLEGVFESVMIPGTIGAGTFYNLFTYQYISLAYLPFALIGFFFLLKRKDFNPLFLLFAINGLIVVFELFFFNRLIINLDIAAILLGGYGIAYSVFYSKGVSKNLKVGIIILLIISGAISAMVLASSFRPLISETQLNSIKKIPAYTEENALVMATVSTYSPWVLGYSKRSTIAPGLFDHDLWNELQWQQFWAAGNLSEISSLLDIYPKPLYIFIGNHASSSRINMQKFTDPCFEKVFEDNGGLLYKYGC